MGFRFKLDPSKKQIKTVLKYIIVTRLQQQKKSLTHMAIVTNDGKFAEYEFGIYCNSITPTVASRIRWTFEGFKIDSNTEVIFNQEYGTNEPVYMYFQFLRQQIEFNMRKVRIESILRTIVKYHGMFYKIERTQIFRNFLDKVWTKIVEKNRCPWITKEFDSYLLTIDKNKAKERKLIRLSAYYLIIKNMLTMNKQKYLN